MAFVSSNFTKLNNISTELSISFQSKEDANAMIQIYRDCVLQKGVLTEKLKDSTTKSSLKDRVEDFKTLIHYSQILTIFLLSKVGQELFSFLQVNASHEKSQLEKENSWFEQYQRIITTIQEIEDPKAQDAFNKLLPHLHIKISSLLDFYLRDGEAGLLFLKFLKRIENPQSFYPEIERQFLKPQEELRTYLDLVLDIGFFQAYASNVRIDDLAKLHKRDATLVKALLELPEIFHAKLFVEVGLHSPVFAASLITRMKNLPQQLQKPFLNLLESNLKTKQNGPSYTYVTDVESLIKLTPFFDWVEEEKSQGKPLEVRFKKIGTCLSQENRLIVSLLSIPKEKARLWIEVVDHFKVDFTLKELKTLFEEKSELDLYLDVFEPWDGKKWKRDLTLLLEKDPQRKEAFSRWIEAFLPTRKIEELDVVTRKWIISFLELANEKPELVLDFLNFAANYPRENKNLESLILILKLNPEPFLIPFFHERPYLIDAFAIASVKDEDLTKKISTLIGKVDPFLIEYIMTNKEIKNHRKKFVDFATDHPDLLASMIELEGLAGIPILFYLSDHIDSKTVELLLNDADLRKCILKDDVTNSGEVRPCIKREIDFSLILKALNRDPPVATALLFLARDFPSLCTELLDEMLSSSESNPRYKRFLDLAAKATSPQEKESIRRLMKLTDKDVMNALLSIGEAESLGILNNFLDVWNKGNENAVKQLIHFGKTCSDTQLVKRHYEAFSLQNIPLFKTLHFLPAEYLTDISKQGIDLAIQKKILAKFLPSDASLIQWIQRLLVLNGEKEKAASKEIEELLVAIPEDLLPLLFKILLLSRSEKELYNGILSLAQRHPYPALVEKFISIAQEDPDFWPQCSRLFEKKPQYISIILDFILEEKRPQNHRRFFKNPHLWDEEGFDFVLAHAHFSYDFLEKGFLFLNSQRSSDIRELLSKKDMDDSEKCLCILEKTSFKPMGQTFAQYSDSVTKDVSLKKLSQRGFREEIEKLEELKKTSPDDAMTKKLLALAYAGNGKLLKALLKLNLEKYPELKELLIDAPEFEKIDLCVSHLILWAALEREELFKAAFPKRNDPFIRELILAGRFYFLEKFLLLADPKKEAIRQFRSDRVQELLLDLLYANETELFQKQLSLNMPEQEMVLTLQRIHFFLVHDTIEIFGFNEQKVDLQVKGLKHELIEENAFALAAADLLVSKNGNINPFAIEYLQKTPFYRKQIEQKTSQGVYLEKTLNMLASYPEFGSKLSTIKKPPANTSSEKLIQRMLRLSEKCTLTDRNAQVAVLSALLSRPRQAPSIGSCFGTCLSVQLHSSPRDLFVSLHDYSDLMEKGKLMRNAKSYAHNLLPEKMRSLGNELVRTREFLIASFAATTSSKILEKNLRACFDLFGLIDVKLWGMLYRKKAIGIDRRRIMESLKAQFIQNSYELYDPFLKGPEFKGGWRLGAKEEISAIENEQQFQEHYLRIAKMSKIALLKSYPEAKEEIEEVVDSLIQWFAKDSGEKDSFIKSVSNLRSKEKDEEGIDRFRFTYGAGHSDIVKEVYHELKRRNSTSLPSFHYLTYSPRRVFLSIINQVEEFLPFLKDDAMQNPEKLIPLDIPKHAMSLKPHSIVKRLLAGESAQTIERDLKKEAERIGALILPQNQKEQILSLFCEDLKKSELQMLQNSVTISEGETLRKYCLRILEKMVWVKGSSLEIKKFESDLEGIVLSQVLSISDLKMQYLIVGDFNWNYENHNNGLLAFTGSFLTNEIQGYVLHGEKNIEPYNELQYLRFYEPFAGSLLSLSLEKFN